MNKSTRVRFAPSPTGFLHIGGARTALFNFLFARATGGKFLLRIEDTDRERSEERFTKDIMESLKWLGMQWDEEPVFQSSRFGRYQEIANSLVEKGFAYRCDCSADTLNAIRAQCEKEKKPFRYPGTCRTKKDIKSNFVIRMNVPKTGETAFEDLIRGRISFQNQDVDDWVIQRADGSPTYNFCVVIDDHDLGMTHILRGDDHINNTPKQILLYQTLGFETPLFAHLPMILGPDRQKLSKRHSAASTLEYRAMGYLPEAIVNFLVRLGWSHGDQEIFTKEELFKYFSIEKIGKANAIFNVEKLNWISGHFMRETPAEKFADYLKTTFPKEIAFAEDVPRDLLCRGITITQGKVKNCLELIEQLQCLFGTDPTYSTETFGADDQKRMKSFLMEVASAFKGVDFRKDQLEPVCRTIADKAGVKLAVVAQAVRFAVTGGKISPGLFDMLEIQGKEKVLRRISNALQALP